MTLLQLCQKLHLLLRIGEDTPGTAPTTVTAQTGVLAELVSWIQYAYRDIQNHKVAWLFRRKLGTFTLTASQQAYTVANIVASVTDYQELQPSYSDGVRRHILIHETSVADQTQVFYIPWEDWSKGIYDRGTIPEGRPVYFTVKPDGSLVFYPTPSENFVISFDYIRSLHTITSDANEPIIPERHQDAIIWWAMRRYYGTTRDVPRSILETWDIELRREMNSLYNGQLPENTV